MKRAILLMAPLALVLGLTGRASAAPILMSTDGVSGSNNARAATLGNAVTALPLANIITMSQAALSAFKVIWINPGDPNYNALRTGVAPGGALSQYVANGGTLVINIAGNSGSQNDIAPGGVDYTNYIDLTSDAHEAETFTSPGNPYLTGAFPGGVPLSPSDFNNWFSTDHGHLSNLLPGTSIVLNAAGLGGFGHGGDIHGPTFIQYKFGAGNVILDTLTYGWGSNGAQGNPRDNLLRFAVSLEATPVPEPASLAVFGMSLAGAGLYRWRRRKQPLPV